VAAQFVWRSIISQAPLNPAPRETPSFRVPHNTRVTGSRQRSGGTVSRAVRPFRPPGAAAGQFAAALAQLCRDADTRLPVGTTDARDIACAGRVLAFNGRGGRACNGRLNP
jgi:hypothetical protein